MYNIGLRKPSGGFPAAMLLSFKRATILAKVGAAADVPLMSPARPLKYIRYLLDSAETSGYAYKKERG